jgi:hypothetical protein
MCSLPSLHSLHFRSSSPLADPPPRPAGRRGDPAQDRGSPAVRPAGVPLGPRTQPIAARLGGTPLPLGEITGYRITLTPLGARLAVRRLGGGATPIRDLALVIGCLGPPGEPPAPRLLLARAILVHWLDREVPEELARRLAVRYLDWQGDEFFVPAREVVAFLAGQGVRP